MSFLPKNRLVKFLSSFGLATFSLICLLIITFLGTVEQTEHGLFESQSKYFESWFVRSIDVGCVLRSMQVPYDGVWNLSIIFPGGLLSMIILGVNMTLGGILRFDKELIFLAKSPVWLAKFVVACCTWNFKNLPAAPHRIGVLISHFSIVFMLIAGLVSMLAKRDGAMSILEGRTNDEFLSFHNSVVEIEKLNQAKDAKRTAVVIHDSYFKDLREGKGRTFTHEDVPFELMIYNYEINAAPLPQKDPNAKVEVVDGYYIHTMKPDVMQEKNADAAYIKVTLKDGSTNKGILWRYAAEPFTVKVGEDLYGISLNRRAEKLPFAVRLDKFIHEVHAGTSKARKFSANVTVIDADKTEHKRPITMNDPLRRDGYALFQSSFDPTAESEKRTPSTVLQVVNNPSDNWPLWSCIAAGIGLAIHFVWMLVRYLRKMKAKSQNVPQPV